MKKITLCILLLLSHICTVSCERQEILKECFCTNSAKIPITVDWSNLSIVPQNVTMMFYNNSDGSFALEHRYEHNNNSVHSYVHVPEGEYTVVIFNELRGQVNNIDVREHNNLSTLGFYAKANHNAITYSKGHSHIHQPGELAVKTIRNLIVTSELIAYTHGEGLTKVSNKTKSNFEMLLNIAPNNKISWLDITIHIDGLNNARMPALVDLQNISEGYMVGDDKNCATPKIMQFDMNNRTYDTGSLTDGTISTRVALWGTLGDRTSIIGHHDAPMIIDVLFMLVDKDKTLVNIEVDITNIISFDEEVSGSISLDLNVDMDSALPDVEPEGGDDSGFGSELEDWDEIEVPLS